MPVIYMLVASGSKAPNTKMAVFRDVEPCSLSETDRNFMAFTASAIGQFLTDYTAQHLLTVGRTVVVK
jgi:hypothetical protein